MTVRSLSCYTAMAAASLLTFTGAGTASATTLCEKPSVGDCTSPVAEGTNLVFSAENSLALTGPFGILIDTCTTSVVEVAVTNAGSTTSTVKGNITKLTFANCTRPTTVKTTSGTNTWGTTEVHHIAGTDTGTVKSTDTTITIHEVPEEYGTCHYLTNNTSIGTLTGETAAGAGPPTFDISANISSENGCPTGLWEGRYIHTGETSFGVTAGNGLPFPGTALCEETPAGECGSPVAKETNLVFSAETSVALTGPFGLVIVTCTNSTVEATTSNTGGPTESVSGKIRLLTFANCNRPVTVTNTSGGKTWGTLEVNHIANTDNGRVTSEDTTVTIHEVPFAGTCHFKTENTPIGTLTGKSASGISVPTFHIAALITSENGCWAGTWEGNYRYTGKTPFDVTAG